MKILLKTMPLSTNALYAHVGKRRFLTQKASGNKEAIGWEARTQYRGKPLAGPLRGDIYLYWPTERRHDLDNIKGLLDALTGILYEDDNQFKSLWIRKGVDKENPRVEIGVELLNEKST